MVHQFVHGHFTSKVKRLKKLFQRYLDIETITTLTNLHYFQNLFLYITFSHWKVLHLALSPQGHEHSAWHSVDAQNIY